MSKYTTEVRFICENAAGLSASSGLGRVEEIVTVAAPKIFDFEWPIFSESYRLELEKKILLAYYTREICEETVGLWKLRLRNKMNMIMPKYNQLYESAQLKFDPFNDVNYTRKGSNSGSGTSEDSSTNTNSGKNLYSDTPQNGLTDVESGEYLTNATVTSGSGETSSNGRTTSKGQFEENVNGKMGGSSYSRLLSEYRETFLNIDEMVIGELNDLFMGLW